MQPYDPSSSPTAAGSGSDVWAERPGIDPAAAQAHGARKKTAKGGPGDGHWERSVLEKLAMASIKEQRAARRWRIFFTLIFLGYLGFITWSVLQKTVLQAPLAETHTAVVRIKGLIADEEEASAGNLYRSLQKAFEAPNAKAVLLQINSPGGSPVQAGILRDEILRLKVKHSKPVYAVIGELGASAAYYVAVAADRIYVDKASMVGSIGVLMNGFGFTGTMDKLGVERRLLSAGEHKGFLDPFSPQDPADVAHAKTMLRQIHAQFIAVVREGRGARLKESPELFSGLVWTGEQAIELGLADGTGSVYSVARDVVKQDKIVDYTQRKSLADKLVRQLGSTAGHALGSSLGQEAAQALRAQGPQLR